MSANKITVAQLVKNAVSCKFQSIKAGFLYYLLEVKTDEWDFIDGEYTYKSDYYRFTVPIEDTVGGEFERNMKPLTMMRWIRKAQENNELVKL